MIGPLALGISALLALYLGRGLEIWSYGAPGSGLLPMAAAVILLLASLGSFTREPGSAEGPGNLPRAACYAVGLVAIPPAVMLLGMLPALALFTAIILRLVEAFRMPTVAAVTGASVLGNWLLFDRLLHVALPKPIFW
ncbi:MULTISPECIES: tripartite tricarboxylate transporter TctB family protein [Rhodomicrobium]|uniref:tripartite tricarboxylate transporter TctB family protein n=1 Tax=Rhodomicrobium TaxID=1068 RepID=UPI000B4BF4E6|nr:MULTISPECIES: tripartite tricarboxylate transporter TctB family protein [Rhodomicrobium]